MWHFVGLRFWQPRAHVASLMSLMRAAAGNGVCALVRPSGAPHRRPAPAHATPQRPWRLSPRATPMSELASTRGSQRFSPQERAPPGLSRELRSGIPAAIDPHSGAMLNDCTKIGSGGHKCSSVHHRKFTSKMPFTSPRGYS